MRPIAIILMGICFGLTGCSDPAPKELIPEETYKRMFIEFTIINQYDEHVLQEQTPEDIRRQVYDRYGVTAEEFRISHEYYEQDTEMQLQRIDEISKMMRAERDTLLEAERQFNHQQRTPPDTLRQRILNR